MPVKKLHTDCFKIVNKNGEPVLFRTDNLTINKLTFTITNLMSDPISLTGGDPVKLVKGNPEAGTGAASSFNIGFESMLTGDVVKNLQLTLPAGWKAAFFEGTKEIPPSWSIAPSANMTLAVKETITVVIENISCATTRPGACWGFSCLNLGLGMCAWAECNAHVAAKLVCS